MDKSDLQDLISRINTEEKDFTDSRKTISWNAPLNAAAKQGRTIHSLQSCIVRSARLKPNVTSFIAANET